jgi:hypothetical protein
MLLPCSFTFTVLKRNNKQRYTGPSSGTEYQLKSKGSIFRMAQGENWRLHTPGGEISQDCELLGKESQENLTEWQS